MNEIKAIKISKSEELELLAKAKAGDVKASHKLIFGVMPLIRAVARRTRRDCDDLEQVAVLGVYKAIEQFDTSFGVRFSSYAIYLIRKEMQEHLSHDHLIGMSVEDKKNGVRNNIVGYDSKVDEDSNMTVAETIPDQSKDPIHNDIDIKATIEEIKTPTHKDAMKLILEGRTTREIETIMKISRQTVCNIKDSFIEKCQLSLKAV